MSGARGLLVYRQKDAQENRRFIERCISSAQAHRLSLRLLLCDSLGENEVPAADFALMRTRDPALSRRFEAAGLRIFNSAYFNETANDKLLTYDRLHDLVQMPTSLDGRLHNLPPFLPCVLKAAHGHGGKNVYLAYDVSSYQAARLSILPDIPVLQPLLDKGRDLRIYLVGGEPVCAMLRTSPTDFRSNYKLGGSARAVEPTAEELAIAAAVHARIPVDYAGIDIIYDHGRPVLNELEDPVGARMVYENTDIDMASLLFAHIERVMRG